MDDDAFLFNVMTPLGFRVHCSETYWLDKIVADHPVMRERIEAVQRTLTSPSEIRLSRSDDDVYLFYADEGKRLVCAVARSIDSEGFLITAYPADKMKEGKTVWTK